MLLHWRSRGFKTRLLALLLIAFVLYKIWSSTEDNYGIESELIIQRHRHHGDSDNKEEPGVRVCTQRERGDHVTAMCQNLTTRYMDYSKAICYKAVNPEMEGQGPCLLVDHQHRVAFCGITKSGSSTGIAMMMNYGPHGNKPPIKYRKGEVHTPELKAKMGLVQEIYTPELENYTKFMIVRHPMDRLVSSYLDKMQPVDITGRFKSLRLEISIIYGDLTWDKLNGPLKDIPDVNVTFENFMKMLNDPHVKPHINDEHWATSGLLCDPCRVHYDYIMRTESLHYDARKFIKSVYNHKNNNWTVPTENVNRDIAELTQQGRVVNKVLSQYYDSVQQKDLQLLVNKYKTDLELYGYSFKPNTYEARCGIHTQQNDICC